MSTIIKFRNLTEVASLISILTTELHEYDQVIAEMKVSLMNEEAKLKSYQHGKIANINQKKSAKNVELTKVIVNELKREIEKHEAMKIELIKKAVQYHQKRYYSHIKK